MKKGLSGDNLSGIYGGLQFGVDIEQSATDYINSIKTIGIAPVWGLQRQFFKRFLFDFSTGPERLYNFINDKNGWNFFSELRLGVAF
ncbi:MAG: hypothetical protein AB8G86_29545 [Saprospiraceae bacterium]